MRFFFSNLGKIYVSTNYNTWKFQSGISIGSGFENSKNRNQTSLNRYEFTIIFKTPDPIVISLMKLSGIIVCNNTENIYFFPKFKKSTIPVFKKFFIFFNFFSSLINIVKWHIKLTFMKFPLKWDVKQPCRTNRVWVIEDWKCQCAGLELPVI